MRNIFSSALVRTLSSVMLGGMMMASSAAAQTLDPISVRLDWAPWGGHAAFHLAQEKGWYKEAGLNVRFEDGNGSVTTVQIVGSGDSFDLGHADLASMMIARDKGLPVKAVGVFAPKSDIGLLVPEDSDIKGPADLKGKKVAYGAGSLEAPFVDFFLSKGGLTRNDVDLLSVDAAGKVTTYAVGRADAVVSTIPGVIAFVSSRRPSVGIPFADFGLNTPSFGIFTNEAKLASKRDAISRFASVTSRAWQYVFDGNQEEAVQAIMAQRPQSRLNPDILRGQIADLHTYFEEPGKDDRIGIPNPARWEEAAQTLRSLDVISDKIPAQDFYVTDMVHPEKFDNLVTR